MYGKRIHLLALPLLFLAISCSSSLYNMDVKIRRTLAGLSDKSVQVSRFSIAYLEGGTGETVLLLHGFGADKDNWPRFARYLKGKYHIIAPDLPGFGDSSRLPDENYDINSQVKLIHDFAVKIGIKKFHIGGNSMGGLISGVYAATYPDDVLSLLLLDPGGVTDRQKSRLTHELEKGNNPLIVSKASDFEKLVDFVFVDPPFIPGSVKTYLGEKAVLGKGFLEKVFVEAKPGDQLERRMNSIKAKTLIIWGDTDRIFPASSGSVLEKGIAQSQLIIMKNCGHVPMMERPGETAEHYLSFLGYAAD